jgi:hypothetical protein
MVLDTLVLWHTNTLVPDEHTTKFWLVLREMIGSIDSRSDNLLLLKRFVDYLARFPRLTINCSSIEASVGFGTRSDIGEGLRSSLACRRLNNALFYAAVLIGQGQRADVLNIALSLAAQNINPGGAHNFGHKFTIISALVNSARRTNDQRKLQCYVSRILEFLARYEPHNMPSCQCHSPAQVPLTFEDVISHCAERPGEMGHNIILTYSALANRDNLSHGSWSDLVFQIHEQIINPWKPHLSPRVTFDQVLSIAGHSTSVGAGDAAKSLRTALQANDQQAAYASLLCYIDAKGLTQELLGICAANLARHADLRALEHACTFPYAAFGLAALSTDPHLAKLMICQLIMPPGAWQLRSKQWEVGEDPFVA